MTQRECRFSNSLIDPFASRMARLCERRVTPFAQKQARRRTSSRGSYTLRTDPNQGDLLTTFRSLIPRAAENNSSFIIPLVEPGG